MIVTLKFPPLELPPRSRAQAAVYRALAAVLPPNELPTSVILNFANLKRPTKTRKGKRK